MVKYYGLRRTWIFDPINLTVKLETSEVKDEKLYSLKKNAPEFNSAIRSSNEFMSKIKDRRYYLNQPHLSDLLKAFDSKDSSILDEKRSIPANQYPSTEMESIPTDTILNAVPDISVVKQLTYSSLDTAVKQLNQWGIPYFRDVRLPRGKSAYHLSYEGGQPVLSKRHNPDVETGVVILVKDRGGEECEESVFKKVLSSSYYEFNFPFGHLPQEDPARAVTYCAPLRGSRERFTREVQILSESEIEGCFQVSITQDDATALPEGFEAAGFVFNLTPGQKARIEDMSNQKPDKIIQIYGYVESLVKGPVKFIPGSGKETRRIEYIFDVHSDGKSAPTLTKVLIVLVYQLNPLYRE